MGVEMETMTQFMKHVLREKYVLQNNCECNRLISTLMRRLTHKGQCLPAETLTEVDKHALEYFQKWFLKSWRKFTNSRPLTADELLAVKEGRIDKMIQHCGQMGVVLKSGNLAKYRRQHQLMKERGLDTSSTITPPVSWMRKKAFVNDFPKVESLLEGKFTRTISPRHPAWTFVMSQFSCAAEKNFYVIMDADKNSFVRELFPFATGSLVGKGLNSLERGNLVVRKWKNLEQRSGKKVVCLGTDCEGFDTHVRTLFRVHFGEVFDKMFPQFKRWLQAVWKDVVFNRGGGDYYRWTVDGGVQSGDSWTAWGNVYLIILLIWCAIWVGGKSGSAFDVLSDGDDCLMFMLEEEYLSVRDAVDGFFRRAGHVLKWERCAKSVWEVVWCQSKIVEVEDSTGSPAYKFVHNPAKMIAVLGSMTNMRTADEAEQYVGDVLFAYSVLNRGVPLYDQLARLCPPQRRFGLSAQTGLALELSRESVVEYRSTPRTYKTFCDAWMPSGVLEAILNEIDNIVRHRPRWIQEEYLSIGKTPRGTNSWFLGFPYQVPATAGCDECQ